MYYVRTEIKGKIYPKIAEQTYVNIVDTGGGGGQRIKKILWTSHMEAPKVKISGDLACNFIHAAGQTDRQARYLRRAKARGRTHIHSRPATLSFESLDQTLNLLAEVLTNQRYFLQLPRKLCLEKVKKYLSFTKPSATVSNSALSLSRPLN